MLSSATQLGQFASAIDSGSGLITIVVATQRVSKTIRVFWGTPINMDTDGLGAA